MGSNPTPRTNFDVLPGLLVVASWLLLDAPEDDPAPALAEALLYHKVLVDPTLRLHNVDVHVQGFSHLCYNRVPASYKGSTFIYGFIA